MGRDRHRTRRSASPGERAPSLAVIMQFPDAPRAEPRLGLGAASGNRMITALSLGAASGKCMITADTGVRGWAA